MQDIALTLGEKIKNFRKRAGMSQMELENAIGAANGSVSRIESGKVNPTKETILKITSIMHLGKSEVADILRVRSLQPTQFEINQAIQEAKPFLDSVNVLAYLIDENATLIYVSIGLQKLFSIDETTLDIILGKNILEVILNPKYKIQQYLDHNRNIPVYTLELARILRETNSPELLPLDFIKQLPVGEQMIDNAKSLPDNTIFSANNKHAYLRSPQGLLMYSYARERLKQNDRFELIEFFNPRRVHIKIGKTHQA